MTENYDEHRKRQASRQRQLSMDTREISALPTVANSRRKARCKKNLATFLKTYFPAAFPLPWSDNQKAELKAIERAIRHGGLQAIAAPRGDGKTTRMSRSLFFAICYGFRFYAMLICADEIKAEKAIKALRTEAETNELLLADFPEIFYPIRRLERIAQRGRGQTLNGKPTDITWTGQQLVFPTVPKSAASGAVIEVGSLESAVRGAQYTKPMTGEVIRPNLLLVDDPQTRASAKSELLCEYREEIIANDLLGMVGPGETMSALMACTVIYPHDMADKMLNRDLHPEWHGIRTGMIEEWPDETVIAMWETYYEKRKAELRTGGDGSIARSYYRKNRKAMDQGIKVGWKHRKEGADLSAIETAMRLYLKNPSGFMSEYQNRPVDEKGGEESYISADDLAAKTNGLQHRVIPLDADYITAFIDVQLRLLYYVVTAWRKDGTGWILDYGTYPEQKRRTFTAADAARTLQHEFQGTFDYNLRRGLETLIGQIRQPYADEAGNQRFINVVGIDANWGDSTHVIKSLLMRSELGQFCLPTHGKGIKAEHQPMHAWKGQKGEQAGIEWRLRYGNEGRHLLYDTNFWKTQTARRLTTAQDAPGCVDIYGRKTQRHSWFATQLTAESHTLTSGKGRTVEVWTTPPGVTENHWLDCLVGCNVLGSLLGVVPPGYTAPETNRRSSGGKQAKRKKGKVRVI